MLTDEEIEKVEMEARSAIIHLQRIKTLSEGKDNNVAFLADSRSKDVESIVKCAKLKGHNMPK